MEYPDPEGVPGHPGAMGATVTASVAGRKGGRQSRMALSGN